MGAWKQRYRFWTQGLVPLPLLTIEALVAVLLILYACQDNSDLTEPSAATAAVARKLTILPSGNGTGKVTSSPVGINCQITNGVASATGCSKLMSGTVTLTATSAAGHAFAGWTSSASSCTGTGGCKVGMSVDRKVTARFNKGPFTIKISSGLPGGGSGTVKSQAGLFPRINCVITNGAPGATGCSARYPAYTGVTLSVTPAAGQVFDGWREPGCGTGSCLFTIIQNRTIPTAFTPAPANSPALEGRWDPPFTTPVVVVHAHLLLNSKVLLWGDTGDAQLWGAAAGFTPVTKTHRMYCSGHAFLPDGRLLVMGGTSADIRGLRVSAVFNPASSSWNTTGSMAQGRYYPTATTLPNGEILVVSGHDTNKTVVTIPEIYGPGGWRRLTTAPLAIPTPYYPAMFVAPNGKVFLAGFTQPSQYLDVTGTGHWTPVAPRRERDRVLGSAVMYAPGKILYVGGGNGLPYDAAPTASAEVIDLNQAAPVWRSVAGMSFARRQLNATLLADGSVLVTGGTSGPGFNNQGGAVHVAELWDPETETWRLMASEARNRTYHSTALLLPSGRVLSSGSGEGGDVPYANSEFSAQAFSPPYLFNSDGSLAARPRITTAPASLSYGQTFSVETPDAGTVTRGNLIRLSSVTHAFNQSQLNYPLTFSATGSTTLSAVAPPSGSFAPPGPYMLFLVNSSGVPSTAKFVMIGP